jgi:hypothetical protein
MMAKKDIVVAENLDLAVYDVLREGVEEITSMIQSNVGSTDLNEFSLPRAINPSGKSTRWEIPGITDDSEFVSEVEGIIAAHKESRVYYVLSYDESGGNERPDCVGSVDPETNVMIGEGNPGGICAKCKYSKFTKLEDGTSEAPKCRQLKQVFVLRPGEIMPTKFNATGGNVNQVANYLLNLTIKGWLKYNHCVTKLKITADKYKNGRDWAKWTLSLVSPLPPEVMEQMDAFGVFLEPILSNQEVTAEDVVDEDGSPF